MAGTYTKRGSKYRLQYMKNGVRYSETIAATNDKEAKLKLADFVLRIEKGNYYNTDYTFSELANMWLEKVQQPNSSPVTIDKYKSYLDNRILPYIGKYKLNNISVPVLTDYFNTAKKFKTLTKVPRPISKATLEKLSNIVSAIMQKAYEWELIESNPCNKIRIKYDNLQSEIDKNKKYGIKKEQITSYTKEEYKIVLQRLSNESDPFRLFIESALKTGMSKEELLGLKWTDFDIENKTLSVKSVRLMHKGSYIEKQPKAHSRLRSIVIPDSLVLSLSQYKNGSDFIFDKINPNSINSSWSKFCKKNNIRKIRIHDLRHTHATLLLAQGVDIKTISQRLGHSNISITMNTYTDVLQELDKSAAHSLDCI